MREPTNLQNDSPKCEHDHTINQKNVCEHRKGSRLGLPPFKSSIRNLFFYVSVNKFYSIIYFSEFRISKSEKRGLYFTLRNVLYSYYYYYFFKSFPELNIKSTIKILHYNFFMHKSALKYRNRIF